MNFPVSVIIPTYQRANLIGETIESVLAQTITPNEVIIVDDGSTDDTELVCRQFGDRIMYRKTENRGCQSARNTGASLSSSPWLTFLDSDDLMQPDHLESIARLVVLCPQVNFVFSNWMVFGENVDDLWRTTSAFDMAPKGFWDIAKRRVGDAALLDGCSLALSLLDALDFQPIWSTCCISRELFNRAGGYDPGMSGVPSEDFEFTFRCLIGGGEVGMTTRPTLRIRKHGGNTRGGGIRQAIGEMVVYGHIARRHILQSSLSKKALEKARFRCVDALNFAFASGQLGYVRALSRPVRMDRKHLSGKLMMKIAVASLPVGVGRILNSILVRRKIEDSRPISSRLESKLYETVDFLSGTASASKANQGQ
ncbi:MAG: glycosyltransferase family 2 protein [Terracidiphilus sp.]